MRKIEVIDYNPLWPKLFVVEHTLLNKTLGEVVLGIHHIGSTSVPGLAAKPIIDILIEVTSVTILDTLQSEMISIGYQPKGEFGIVGRRYFWKGNDNHTHHIHAFASGDPNLKRHVAFRDYLCNYPNIIKEYAELKKSLARTCNNDINQYCEGKDVYVKRIESLALRWYALNG